MSVSAIFGSKMAVLPSFSCSVASGLGRGAAFKTAPRVGGGLVIECSSRPTKKATAHHMKTRPRKTQPWDVRRKPTVYPPLPPLPPEWTLVADDAVPPPPPQPLETE
ncbi:50S ribosomal protein 6, chloroplastic [Diospyros lotus]|uniref:50S ribosomal protein 6, chloroplastic n=1 Tax=Diospyros lotus TaxID=55363 RepID=UPI0022503DD0|nr:50S ribosomal protein 6, chloroplastic [Diospyros lotus]